jgi:hypothetical protein
VIAFFQLQNEFALFESPVAIGREAAVVSPKTILLIDSGD